MLIVIGLELTIGDEELRQFTDITVLLDRSGSMSTIRGAMESAFDEFIKGHKEVPSTKVTLVQFDNENTYDLKYCNVPVGSVEKLNLVPRGMTPLLDAMCITIDKTGERLASLSASERPDQVLLVVITDGQENASKRYTRSNVFDRVSKQSGAYQWKFVYLGANQDAIAEAASLGIWKDYAINYTASAGGSASAMSSTLGNTVAYASNSDGNRNQMRGYTKSQRANAIDPSDLQSQMNKAGNPQSDQTGAK